MTGDLTLTVGADGALTASGDIEAGAVLDVRLTGVEFGAGEAYRLTLKPRQDWGDPGFVVTATAWADDDGDLVGTVNTNSAAMIAWLGSRRRYIAVEIWCDSGNYPVARSTAIYAAPPAGSRVRGGTDTWDWTALAGLGYVCLTRYGAAYVWSLEDAEAVT